MKSMTKKICMLAYTGYTGDPRVRREAETLAVQQDYQVLVIVPKQGKTPKTYVLNHVHIKELNMKQYQGKNKVLYTTSYLLFAFRLFFVCHQKLLFCQVDIFHVHNMPNFLIFSTILAKILGKKIILDIHDSMPETFLTKFETRSNKIIYRILLYEEAICCWLANKIVCVNHPQRNVLVSRSVKSKKITVSLNVPNPMWLKTAEGGKLLRGNAKIFKLVYHGTLAKRLGVDIAIQAIGKLVSHIPHMEFHIYGVGDDSEMFIQLTEELELGEFVHFHKPVPIDDLFPIIGAMDVGLVGNRKSVATELMLPVKMLEYIALDIPVVAPRLKTVQYYFSEDMVSYFEPGNSDSMASSILELYQSREKREGQAKLARKFLDQFGWEQHQEDFLNLYRSL